MVFVHATVLLIFGVVLSVAFTGVKLSRKTILQTLLFCLIPGGLQLFIYFRFSEQHVWWFFPLIVHLPTALFLVCCFKKNVFAAIAAILTSYLLCQPAKWVGVLAYQLSESSNIEYLARLLCLLTVGALSLKYAAPCLGGIFSKDIRSVLVFGILPAVYYLFDYITVVYTRTWLNNNRIAAEFLPLLLCGAFLVFCIVYYQEYEQRADAERKEQIVRLVAAQQAAHIEKVKQVEQELQVARHDMRHVLNQMAACIDADDTAKAKELMQSYITYIDGTRITRYCNCDTINYVLSAFNEQCTQENIPLHCDICLDELQKDELLFCSILQNALDNAYNAQLLIEPSGRGIWLLMKTMDDKLLLSVRNPTKETPSFVDGLPVSGKPGHGYGTQSIRYLSKRLNGSCQFSVHNGMFVLRVLL